MSNDKEYAIARVFKLWAKIGMMIVDGKRDATKVADVLQSILDNPRPWREEDGVIYFTVTSDGTKGEVWIKRLESKGFRVGEYAKHVLRSSGFQPTNGVMTEVAVLKGTLFKDNTRLTKKIRSEASAGTFTKRRKLSPPNPELACLIRLMFTDKEIEVMGLVCIVTMHEPIIVSDSNPIIVSDSDPILLRVDRNDVGLWLTTCYGSPLIKWGRSDIGFAFALSQD